MAQSPQAYAKSVASALMREARQAGWVQAKVEIKPDGSVTVLAAMLDQDQADDSLAVI